MKTITFAAEAGVSDMFASGIVKEIVNTFSFNWKKCTSTSLFKEGFKEIE